MPPSLLVALHYARLSFQRRAAYRLANWTGIAVNFFFFLINAQIFLAFFDGRRVGGWEGRDAVLYFATSQALLMVLGVFPSPGHDLLFRIRSGDVATDLARPVRLYARDLSERYGTAAYFLAARAPVVYGGACLLYGLRPPLGAPLAIGLLSLVLAVGVSASLWFLANASAFWTESAQGPYRAMMFGLGLLGGAFVPLDFYPPAFRAVCEWLPFQAALYTPIAILAGRMALAESAGAVLVQGAWLIVLAGLATAVEVRGVRRLVVQGG